MLIAQVTAEVGETIPAIGLMASILIGLRFLKLVSDKDWNGAATQLVCWLIGMAFVWLWAQSDWADFVSFQGLALSKMNGASLAIAGFGAGSSASLGYVALKAFDNNQSAAEPPLFK
jgi:hypothetical protein